MTDLSAPICSGRTSVLSMQITLEPARIYGIKLGPESTERTFEVLYLDERVRVVQFLPSSPAKGSEPVLFVLRRLGAVHAPKQVIKRCQASTYAAYIMHDASQLLKQKFITLQSVCADTAFSPSPHCHLLPAETAASGTVFARLTKVYSKLSMAD